MQFDFTKTLALVKGGLLDHEATWKNYLGENPQWQQTALVLTGPLIIANVLLGLIFSRLTGGYAYYGYPSNIIVALLMGLVMAGAGFVIAVFVFNFLAGTFKGTPNFSRAFAAVSLAAIPAWVAGVLAALIPAVGFFISLAGGIVSLVFMYKIMPLALEIPDDKRTVHFVVSLVAIIVASMILGAVLGRGAMDSGIRTGGFTSSDGASRSTTGSGMLGEMERQSRLMEQAQADVYDPPGDGKLDEDQVEKYISVLQKTRSLHEEQAEQMKKLEAEMKARQEAGEDASPADLAKIYAGIGTAVSANNAEMEVVKTGGGNWAEHIWVKEQLRIAHVQQGDGSESIEHNYELYKKYESSLEDSR
jgi:hypothetical protein